MDPLTNKYPELTPYQFASNTPIMAIDLDGLEAWRPITFSLMKPTIKVVKSTDAAVFKLGFSHYLPKKLIEHYANGDGSDYKLSKQEMIDANVYQTGIQGRIQKDIDQFNDELANLKPGESNKNAIFNVLGFSATSGALGGFTIKFEGTLTKDKKDPTKWSFEGTMQYVDEWNFDSHSGSVKKGEKEYRSTNGDMVTTFAGKYLIGAPFWIKSDKYQVKQTSSDQFIDWFKFLNPQSVPNRVYKSEDAKKAVKKDN